MGETFLSKMKGTTTSPPRAGVSEILWGWIGGFAGMATVGLLSHFVFAQRDMVLIVGSLGASAVLVFGATKSPLAQPRNLMGGHLLSAFIGVSSHQLFSLYPWFAGAFAVATAIAIMHATKTLHPPGGATALIAVIGSDKIHQMGYLYVLVPAGVGPFILLSVALIVNNIPAKRRYPEFWW